MQVKSTPTNRLFLRAFADGLGILWPVLSGLLLGEAMIGSVIGLLEGWGLWKGIYFASITALTIGYGDLVPSHPVTQILAVSIGFLGIVFMGLIAALAVKAFDVAQRVARS
jgi:ion channel